MSDDGSKPAFVIMKISKKDGSSVNIYINDGDDPRQVAQEFVSKNQLPDKVVSKLTEQIELQVHNARQLRDSTIDTSLDHSTANISRSGGSLVPPLTERNSVDQSSSRPIKLLNQSEFPVADKITSNFEESRPVRSSYSTNATAVSAEENERKEAAFNNARQSWANIVAQQAPSASTSSQAKTEEPESIQHLFAGTSEDLQQQRGRSSSRSLSAEGSSRHSRSNSNGHSNSLNSSLAAVRDSRDTSAVSNMARSTSPSSVRSLPTQRLFQKLHEESQLQQERLAAKAALLEKQRKEELAASTFKATIGHTMNSPSRRPHRHKAMTPGASYHESLYESDMQWKLHRENSTKKLAQRLSEQRGADEGDYTFQPQLITAAHMQPNRSFRIFESLHNDKDYYQERFSVLKDKVQAEQNQELTFIPQIDAHSNKLARRVRAEKEARHNDYIASHHTAPAVQDDEEDDEDDNGEGNEEVEERGGDGACVGHGRSAGGGSPTASRAPLHASTASSVTQAAARQRLELQQQQHQQYQAFAGSSNNNSASKISYHHISLNEKLLSLNSGSGDQDRPDAPYELEPYTPTSDENEFSNSNNNCSDCPAVAEGSLNSERVYVSSGLTLADLVDDVDSSHHNIQQNYQSAARSHSGDGRQSAQTGRALEPAPCTSPISLRPAHAHQHGNSAQLSNDPYDETFSVSSRGSRNSASVNARFSPPKQHKFAGLRETAVSEMYDESSYQQQHQQQITAAAGGGGGGGGSTRGRSTSPAFSRASSMQSSITHNTPSLSNGHKRSSGNRTFTGRSLSAGRGQGTSSSYSEGVGGRVAGVGGGSVASRDWSSVGGGGVSTSQHSRSRSLTPSRRSSSANKLFDSLYDGRIDSAMAQEQAAAKHSIPLPFRPNLTATRVHNHNLTLTSSTMPVDESQEDFFQRLHDHHHNKDELLQLNYAKWYEHEMGRNVENDPKISKLKEQELVDRLAVRSVASRDQRKVSRFLQQSRDMEQLQSPSLACARSVKIAQQARLKSLNEIFDILLDTVRFTRELEGLLPEPTVTVPSAALQLAGVRHEYSSPGSKTSPSHSHLGSQSQSGHGNRFRSPGTGSPGSRGSSVFLTGLDDDEDEGGEDQGAAQDQSPVQAPAPQLHEVSRQSSSLRPSHAPQTQVFLDTSNLLDTTRAQPSMLHPKNLALAIAIVITEARPAMLSRVEFIDRVENLSVRGNAPPINALLAAPERTKRLLTSDELMEMSMTAVPTLEARRVTEQLVARRYHQRKQGLVSVEDSLTQYNDYRTKHGDYLREQVEGEVMRECTFEPQLVASKSWDSAQRPTAAWQQSLSAPTPATSKAMREHVARLRRSRDSSGSNKQLMDTMESDGDHTGSAVERGGAERGSGVIGGDRARARAARSSAFSVNATKGLSTALSVSPSDRSHGHLEGYSAAYSAASPPRVSQSNSQQQQQQQQQQRQVAVSRYSDGPLTMSDFASAQQLEQLHLHEQQHQQQSSRQQSKGALNKPAQQQQQRSQQPKHLFSYPGPAAAVSVSGGRAALSMSSSSSSPRDDTRDDCGIDSPPSHVGERFSHRMHHQHHQQQRESAGELRDNFGYELVDYRDNSALMEESLGRYASHEQ